MRAGGWGRGVMGVSVAWLFFVVTAAVCCRASSAAATTSIVAQQPVNWVSWADVDVSWSVAGGASAETDWIGAFIDAWNATYVSWKPINGSNGRVSFNLLNGRHNFIFRLFRGNTVLATSNRVTPLGNTPNQGHLSFVLGRPDEMTISWTSSMGAGEGTVLYGEQPTKLSYAAPASWDTYTSADFTTCMKKKPIALRTTFMDNLANHVNRCGIGCWANDKTAAELYLDPGRLYTATMSGLVSGQRYYYTFGDVLGHYRSPVYSFIAPRVPGDVSGNFSFLATSDMGIGAPNKEQSGGATDNDPPINGADSVMAGILADPLTAKDEFILLNGDLSYARGWPWIWERWFDMIQPLTTQMPMMVGVGNHEIDTDATAFSMAKGAGSGGECGVPVLKRFTHLESLDKMWYSFSHGSVKWFVISTEHSISKQTEWFKQEMATVNRSITPYVLVTLHRPMFMSHSRSKLNIELTASWHGLFVEHKIDFVYTGHSHYYERMCAVDTEKACSTTRDRPVYVVDGSAGAEFAPSKMPPYSPLTMYKEVLFWGYSRFEVTPEAITFKHYHTDNTMVDSVTLPNAWM